MDNLESIVFNQLINLHQLL